jgi:hypothetical protein
MIVMPTRRTFLKQASLASAGLMFVKNTPFASQPLIGLQLWTVRRELAKDPEGTLAKVAGIGYNSVELMGYENGKFWGLTPAQLTEVLKKI